MGLEYIELAPGFVREVVNVYDAWEGKKDVPMKVQELMMVLEIESLETLQTRDPSKRTRKTKDQDQDTQGHKTGLRKHSKKIGFF